MPELIAMSQRLLIFFALASLTSQPAFADGFGAAALVLLLLVPLVIGAFLFGIVHLLSGETRKVIHTATIAAIAMGVPILAFHLFREDRDEYTHILNSAIGILFERSYLSLGLLIAVRLSLGKSSLASRQASKPCKPL